MDRQRVFGCAMLLLAMASLGSSLVAAKIASGVFPDFVILGFRLGLACVVLAPLALTTESGGWRLGGRIWGLVAVQGLVGVVLLNLLVFEALATTSAASVGVVWGTLPVVVAAMSWALLGERLDGAGAVAATLAALATIFLALGATTRAAGADVAFAALAVAGAVACSGTFTIVGKRLAGCLSPLRVASLVSATALVFVLPPAIVDAMRFDFGAVAAKDWLALVWWSLASGVAYSLCLYAGLARVNANVAGVFTVVVPSTTLVIAGGILGEAVLPAHVLGIGCAAAGLVIVCRRARPPGAVPVLAVSGHPSASHSPLTTGGCGG